MFFAVVVKFNKREYGSERENEKKRYFSIKNGNTRVINLNTRKMKAI